MTAALLGVALTLLAAWDIYGLVVARQGRAAVVVGVAWGTAIAIAVVTAGGMELPTLASVLVPLVRPLSRWVP